MKLPLPKRNHAQLLVQSDTVKNIFAKHFRSMSVFEDFDGAELLDVEESADNYTWTPELVIHYRTDLVCFNASEINASILFAGCKIIIGVKAFEKTKMVQGCEANGRRSHRTKLSRSVARDCVARKPKHI